MTRTTSIVLLLMLLLGAWVLPANAEEKKAPDCNSPADTQTIKADKLNTEGMKLLNNRQFDKAIAKFKEATKIAPDYRDAMLNHGIAMMQQDKFKEALPLVEKAIKLDQKWPASWISKGKCLLELKKYDESLVAYNKLKEMNADTPNLYVMITEVYSAKNDNAKIEETLLEGLKKFPKNESLTFNLANHYLGISDPRAIVVLTQLELINPTIKGLSWRISMAWIILHQYELAHQMAIKSEKLDGRSDHSKWLIAKSLKGMKKWDEAKVAYEQLLKENPESKEYRIELLEIARATLKEKEVKSMAKKLKELHPEDGKWIERIEHISYYHK